MPMPIICGAGVIWREGKTEQAQADLDKAIALKPRFPGRIFQSRQLF